jgi:hypothetical protein
VNVRVSALIGALLTSGCATSLSCFDKSDLSGIGNNNKVVIWLISNDAPQNSDERVKQVLDADEGLKKRVTDECGPTTVVSKVTPGSIPLIGGLSKLLFNLYIDRQINAAAKLQKAAQANYSAHAILMPGELGTKPCILLVRTASISKNRSSQSGTVPDAPGLVALLKMDLMDDNTAFVMRPLYIKASNAVAVTKRETEGSPAAIDLSLAISIRAVGKQLTGFNGLVPVGEGVVSVTDIKLGSGAAECFKANGKKDIKGMTTDTDCPRSDLIAAPTKQAWVSMAMGVTETGKIGVDFDQAAAELKAIKEALGPALSESIKKYLED